METTVPTKVNHTIDFIAGIGIFLYCWLQVGQPFYAAFSFGLFILLGLRFLKELGTGFPIREVLALMPLLQWVIAPFFAYKYTQNDIVYYMPITEDVYFNYAFPGTMAYLVGLYLIPKLPRREILNKNYLENFVAERPYMPGLLVGIALVVNFAMSLHLLPNSLNFFGFILSGFLYVGLFYNMFSRSRFKRTWMIMIMGGLLVFSISNGMFHEFILWMIFFILIFSLYKPSSFFLKVTILAAFVMVGFVIQSIKAPYRMMTWNSGVEYTAAQKNAMFLNIAKERLADPISVFDIENIGYSIIRINAGWVVSRVMYHTPAQTPYANGETIRSALEAVFLPRILAPNKSKAGGRENYLRFTGMKLNENTSINISQLGEAYANFGEKGGVITMFIYGLLISSILNYIFSLANKHAAIIFWLPLLFLQVIKAEIDFMIPLNHLFKSGMVVVFFFWAHKMWLKNRKSKTDPFESKEVEYHPA